jgi:hypothetical protein
LSEATAIIVAHHLHDKYYENMMALGEAQEFNVVFVPGSLYTQIRIGENVLWDSEDENDGEIQEVENVERYCEKRLKDLADMFAACKKEKGK